MLARRNALIILGLVLSTLGASPVAFRLARAEAPEPSWKTENLGRTWFSLQSDVRGGTADHWTHSINERGLISGQEFLNLAQPMARPDFDRMMIQRGNKPEQLDKLFKDYVASLTRQAFAVLRMNRILDEEAMKREMQSGATYTRVWYIVRSVLSENAIARDKVPTRSETPTQPTEPGAAIPAPRKVPTEDMVHHYTDAALYVWLKEAVGDKPVRFNIDWNYDNAGLGDTKQYLRQSEEEWPKVTLSFSQLPASVEEFQAQVREKLRPTQLQRARVRAWQAAMNTYFSRQARIHIGPVRDYVPSEDELAALYDVLKDSAFKVSAQVASATEITVNGRKAEEFGKKFAELFASRQKQILAELFPDQAPQPGAQPDPADQDKLRAKIVAYRKSVPTEIMSQTLAQFSDAITAGDLKVSSQATTFSTNGSDPLPVDDSVASQEARALFNPMFESMGLFPKADIKGADGTVHTVYLSEVVAGESHVLPASDSRVQNVLKQRAQGRHQAARMREVAFDLLKYNPFQVERDTCTDPSWPCLDIDPQSEAEALFPETLLAGRELGQDEAGKPITSTLLHPELIDQVADISLDLFSRSFSVPDSKRD